MLRYAKNNQLVYKHLVGELRDYWKDLPCFVIGNGVSKLFYNVNDFKKIGLILGCNKAFRDHHVDFLGHLDTKVRIPCLESHRNYHVMAAKKYGGTELSKIKKVHDRIYFFDFGKNYDCLVNDEHKIVQASTGNIMLQFAFILGCNPVFVGGMDGCAIGDSSNVYEEDKNVLVQTFKGEKTAPHLIKFSRDNQTICEFMKEHGRKVYKIGKWGLLDLTPMEPGEILRWSTK